MLQVQCISRDPLCKMPVDCTSYLLSASPPGFDFNSVHMLRQHMIGSSGFYRKSDSCSLRIRTALDLKPIIIKTENTSDNSTSPTDSGYASVPLSPSSPTPKSSMGRKHVCFADDKGLSLVDVREFNESSNEPPQLKLDLLSRLTEGANAVVTDIPPLKLNFSQPASDYLAFREKVKKSFVSLENAILRDYNLMGTIKVKNISYQKHVFVRYTIDSWKTSTDVPAKYENSSSIPELDTFSFEVDIPANHKVNKKMEFCICFSHDNIDHWDNNNDKNYGITCADWKQAESPSNFNTTDLNYSGEWSKFAGWDNLDSEVPYY